MILTLCWHEWDSWDGSLFTAQKRSQYGGDGISYFILVYENIRGIQIHGRNQVRICIRIIYFHRIYEREHLISTVFGYWIFLWVFSKTRIRTHVFLNPDVVYLRIFVHGVTVLTCISVLYPQIFYLRIRIYGVPVLNSIWIAKLSTSVFSYTVPLI